MATSRDALRLCGPFVPVGRMLSAWVIVDLLAWQHVLRFCRRQKLNGWFLLVKFD